jgi:signal transduction histidine kinase
VDSGEVAIQAEANNGAFYVSVRDIVAGRAKLFQEFKQADDALTKKKGAGLGLAISKRHYRDVRE